MEKIIPQAHEFKWKNVMAFLSTIDLYGIDEVTISKGYSTDIEQHAWCPIYRESQVGNIYSNLRINNLLIGYWGINTIFME